MKEMKKREREEISPARITAIFMPARLIVYPSAITRNFIFDPLTLLRYDSLY